VRTGKAGTGERAKGRVGERDFIPRANSMVVRCFDSDGGEGSVTLECDPRQLDEDPGSVVSSMSPQQSDRALVHATTLYSRRLVRAVVAETHPPLAEGTHDRHLLTLTLYLPDDGSPRLAGYDARGTLLPLEFRAFRAVTFGSLYAKYLCILIIALKKRSKDDILVSISRDLFNISNYNRYNYNYCRYKMIN